MLAQPEQKVEDWLRRNVRDGGVFYLYSVPDNLNEWRNSAKGFAQAFGFDPDPDQLRDSDANSTNDKLRNNFSPDKADRYYLREGDIDLLETEFPNLVGGDRDNHLEVSFGSSHRDRGKHTASGDVETVVATMTDELAESDNIYATVSYQSSYPTVAVQMSYQGSATERIIETIARNGDAVVSELRQRVSE